MTTNNINTMEAFVGAIKEGIESLFGSDYQVRIQNVIKNNNRKLTGICILKKCTNIAPTIYLNDFFDDYRRGSTIDQICQELIRIYEDSKTDTVNDHDVEAIIEFERVKEIICYKGLRVEIQILKQGIKSKARKMETKRSIKPYFNYEFCSDYLQKEIFAVFKDQKHVSYSKAMEIIDKSTYRESEKMVIKSIINLIQKLHGLYPLEEAIKNELKVVPKQYGSLRTFRQKWLNKIRMLGISPITIPDEFGIAEIPSLYNIIQEEI